MKKISIQAVLLSQLGFLLLLPFITDLIRYLHPVAYAVVWLCLTLLISFFVYLLRQERIVLSKRLVIAGLAAYTICLLVLLFMRPSNQSYDSYNLVPFETISFYLSGKVAPLVAIYNLAANIGLFIPYGTAFLLLPKKRPATHLLFAVPVAGIALIELTQWLTRRGSLDIDDLILNVLGVAMGFALTPVVRRVITFS